MNQPSKQFQPISYIQDEGQTYYVLRAADREVLLPDAHQKVRYTFAPTQSGKSSLALRAMKHLAAAGTLSVLVDLTGVGPATTDKEFFESLMVQVSDRLKLKGLAQLLASPADPEPGQQFFRFCFDLVQTPRRRPLVVFVDEMNRLARSPFLERFCSVLQQIRQEQRARELSSRLHFHLLGFDWMGNLLPLLQRHLGDDLAELALPDFTAEQLGTFRPGLVSVADDREANRWLQLVHAETRGHPAWTQKLLEPLCAERQLPIRPSERASSIIALCNKTINLGMQTADPCLVHLRDLFPANGRFILPLALTRALLLIYQRLLSSTASITYAPQNTAHRVLLNLGMARVASGEQPASLLLVRCPIMARNIDEKFVAARLALLGAEV